MSNENNSHLAGFNLRGLSMEWEG